MTFTRLRHTTDWLRRTIYILGALIVFNLVWWASPALNVLGMILVAWCAGAYCGIEYVLVQVAKRYAAMLDVRNGMGMGPSTSYLHVITYRQFGSSMLPQKISGLRKDNVMIIRIRSERIESIQVSNLDQLRMVLEAYGEIPPSQAVQQEMLQADNALEHISATPSQQANEPSQSPTLRDKLKQFYFSLEEGSYRQRALQALAKTESGMVNKELGSILKLEKNQSVAALMSPISRSAKKFNLGFEDIISSENIATPTGRIQVYRLSQAMQEVMKELDCVPKKNEQNILEGRPLFHTYA